MENRIESIPFDKVTITDQFWRKYIDLVRDEVLPYQWNALNDMVEDAEPSHCIKNFKIASNKLNGTRKGRIFQDSDLYKWIEGASYILSLEYDKELDEKIDYCIKLIKDAQMEDGYVNTYFTVNFPDKIFENVRDCHEMYCAGHLIEAAVAHYRATGKKNLLDIACKVSDNLYDNFGKEENKKHGYPGHQEVELALYKLYKVTNNKKYLELSSYFIHERGKKPNYFDIEGEKRKEKYQKDVLKYEPYYPLYKNGYEYNQSHKECIKQDEAVGHAVRAMYQYIAMTDIAKETSDDDLFKACKKLWENVTMKQMYITGAIGSNEYDEAFSYNYDLPNDRVYGETCASVGLVFWANRMLNNEARSNYADILEKALYNGTISGISLDGKKFFYVNPLEVTPKTCEKRHDTNHVIPKRQKWFECACCPPNIARMIASIGQLIYSKENNRLYTHLYISSNTEVYSGKNKLKIHQRSSLPWEGKVSFEVKCEEDTTYEIALRIPEWTDKTTIKINGEKINFNNDIENGYVILKREWNKKDIVDISFNMPIKKVKANPKVIYNTGKFAIQRGPLVYCLEETDNGKLLNNIVVDLKEQFDERHEDILNGIISLSCSAKTVANEGWNNYLYKDIDVIYSDIKIKAIPYYSWANRNTGEMLVWIKYN